MFFFLLSLVILSTMFFPSYQQHRMRSKKLKDITLEFWEFLRKEADNPESVFNEMTMGMRRSGKTALGVKITDELMTDPTRLICFYRQPKALFQVYLKLSPWGINYTDPIDLEIYYFMNRVFNKIPNELRIYEAQKLSEIRNNSIVYFDESLISANAKEALKTELRELGKSNTYWSHKRIILLMNATDDGVIKDLRNKCEIKIYKRLTVNYLESTKDIFIKKNKELLKTLPREKAVLDSNLFNFTKRGIIKFDLQKELPWFTREFSMNLMNASADPLLEQAIQHQESLTPIIDQIIKDLGIERVLKPRLIPTLQGYMIEEGHLEWYNNHKNNLSEIAARCQYKAKILKDKKAREKQENKEDGCEIIFESGDTFASFCLNNLPKENRVNEVFHLLIQGSTQRAIKDALSMSLGKVSSIVKCMSENEIGYYFEDWFASTHGGGDVAHNGDGPDFIDPEGKIYSLKYRYNGDKNITFYQAKNFGPEYREARTRGTKYFVGLYNPRWDQKLQIIEIDPKTDDDKVVISNIKEGKK